SRRVPSYMLPTPASSHRFLPPWLLKPEVSAALGISLAALLNFPSRRANPSCLRPRTRLVTTKSDRRDRFPFEDSANLRLDYALRFRRYPPRKPKRGSV